jgi:hypothetical protein
MKTFIADITIKLESDAFTAKEIENVLKGLLEYDWFDIQRIQVEESKHGFRVQDSDGNWCEPSDGFAAMVKRDEEIFAKMRKKDDEND